MEIKDQKALPDLPGLPTGPTSTIIRNNVFIKNDQPSPDGDRPNVLVGAFPAVGDGSLNTYEIYGNLFLHNHREALFQGSGRVSLHDNIFVDGDPAYAAVVLRKQNGPLTTAVFYNNTIYTYGKGLLFGSRAELWDTVAGNLIFSPFPISGPIMRQFDNLVDTVQNAGRYVKTPSFERDKMDFYPLAGKCQGTPIDLSDFYTDTDFTLDFNGASKVQAKGEVVFRGAYAGDGENPGVRLSAAIKPPSPPAHAAPPAVVWISPAAGQPGSTVEVTLTGANFRNQALPVVSGTGVETAKAAVEGTSRIVATLQIAADAPAGPRSVIVTDGSAPSNAVTFRVLSKKTASAPRP
jgi:hypothetical protein